MIFFKGVEISIGDGETIEGNGDNVTKPFGCGVSFLKKIGRENFAGCERFNFRKRSGGVHDLGMVKEYVDETRFILGRDLIGE